MSRVDAYLAAAESAAALVREPVVARRWSEPSALVGFTVGGLAEHLANQLFSVVATADRASATEEHVPLLEHYARAAWVTAALDEEPNVAIRDNGESAAGEGPANLAVRVDEAVETLRRTLPELPTGHRVRPPAGPWSLSLDDFLLTRIMEITVHSDDLAQSVDAPTPALPSDVVDPVIALLTSLSVRRHGPLALVRALSRSERAPATVSAF